MIQFKNYKDGNLFSKEEFCFIDSDKMKIINFNEYYIGESHFHHFPNLLTFYMFIKPYKNNNIEYYKLIPKEYYTHAIKSICENIKRYIIVYSDNKTIKKLKKNDINKINRLKYLYFKCFNERFQPVY